MYGISIQSRFQTVLGKGLRHQKLLWSLLLTIQFLLPFPFISRHRDIPDEDAYQELARNLVNRHAYFLYEASFHQKPSEPNTYYAPAWPAVLAGAYAITHQPIGFWIATGLIWCVSLVLVRALGMSLRLKPVALWILILWFATYPLYAYYHLHLMTETLAIAIATAILACGTTLVQRPTWQLACVLGILAGLGHLTRTALLLPFAAVWIVFLVSFRTKLLLPAVSLLAYLVIVTPWFIRMHSVHAGFGATEVKLGQNLYLYNYPYVENPYKVRNDEHVDFPSGLEQMTPAQRDSLLMRYGIAEILNHPGKYVLNCLRRFSYLISPLPNFYTSSLIVAVALSSVTIVYLFLPWTVVGLLLVKGLRITRTEAILALTIAFWYGFHTVMHASIRQRLPSDLWVAALAISMGQRFFSKISDHNRKAAALG